MEVKLNIIPKKPVDSNNPRNTYKLWVEVDHGDADFNEENTERFSDTNTEILIQKLKLLMCYWEVDDTGYASEIKLMDEALEKKAKQIEYEGHATDVWCDLVGHDRTCDGQTYCSLESIRLTYFDYNCIECDVMFEINGETTSSITSAFWSRFIKGK